MRKIRLTNFQVFAIVSTSFLPLLFWIYPRRAVEVSGIDGQWAVLGVCMVGMSVALIHGLLNQRFPNISGADVPPITYGKWIGKCISLLFYPGYVLFISVSLYAFVQTLKPFLADTPNFSIVIGLVLIATMGAKYGLETIARAASFLFPLVTLALLIVFIYILSQGSWTGVFVRPVSITNSLHGVYHLMPIFFGVNIILLLSPHYQHRQRNDIWLPVIALGITGIILVLVYLGIICYVGYEGLKELTQPPVFTMRLIRFQGLVVERVGIILIIMTTVFQVLFISNHLWSMGTLTARVFNLESKYHHIFVMPTAVVIVGLFTLITNQQDADWIIRTLLAPLSWFYLIIEPVTKLALSYIRHIKTRPATEP